MKNLAVILILISAFSSACSQETETPAPAAPALTEKSDMEVLLEKTRNNPNDAEAWFHLADLYERNDLYREEADALNKAIAINPADGYAYLKLGNTYNRLKQYPEAVQNFSKAANYISKDPVLYNNMAISYGRTGKIDEEIASLKKAISLRPRYSTARFNLGVAYLKKGRSTDALKEYDELKKFDQGTADSLKKEIDAKGK